MPPHRCYVPAFRRVGTVEGSVQPEAPPGSCACEIAADYLLFTISLAGERVTVAAQIMDGFEDPDPLLKIEDFAAGWDVVFRLVRSMVENEVRSLQRPICSGMIGLPDSWIIG
jgi:hypothetical protein